MKLVLAVLMGAFAPLIIQAAEQVAPGAGSILQQMQPANAPVPSSIGTGLIIEQPSGATLPPSAPFLVNAIQLTGNTLFDTPALQSLVADAQGKRLTLSELGAIVARITNYYRGRGYPLARAIIPAQTVQAGRVRVEIIEAHYAEITLDNHSRVVNPLLQSTLAPLQSGQAIAQAPLNHALLLLSDVPGVVVVATLKPGDTVGSAELLVETAATRSVTGSVTLDNDGNRYTGRARLGGTVSFIDPLQHGDVLSVAGLTSGRDMNYGSLSYESLWDGQGTRVGGSYSALHYLLGSSLAPLDGHGTANVESLWVKHPFVRTQDVNLYAQIQYDHKRLDDEIGASDLHTNRHLDDWTASFAGDLRDSLFSGGINTWSLGWTSGRLGFDDAGAELVDAASARTRGSFSIWNANFSRLQHVSPSNALYFIISGQWANTNLDPAEKMVAGGPYTVRAYDVGALSGDTGVFGSVEFRHDLGLVCRGQLQAVAFVDGERVTINHDVWEPGVNSATLSGAGVGLNWATTTGWHGSVYVATPLGSEPELVGPTKSTQTWVEISKRFD
jgi:hemolysin activation/secretion protein